MRKSLLITAAGALFGLAACGDQLDVTNQTQPDVDRVLSTAAGIEANISGLGAQVFNPQRANESVNTQTRLLSDESFATVANYGMGARLGTRHIVVNAIGNENQVGNLANFNSFQRVARSASNALGALERVRAAGFSTGTAASDRRARAWAFFVLGQSLANISFAYDSGAIVGPATVSSDIPALSGAAAVNAAAIAAYDSVLVLIAAGVSDIPATWMSGNEMPAAEFARLVHTMRARARVQFARNPAERAALDWNAVIADASQGINADHQVLTGGTTGWSAAFDIGTVNTGSGWHMLGLRLYGMADTSGAYQAWAAAPETGKSAFLVRTPDLRWPQGATRAAQQADTPSDALPLPRYIRNRNGLDVTVVGSGDTWYDFRRWGRVAASPTGGMYTDVSRVENDMMWAEGLIRTNQHAAAEPLIDRTRIANGLPSVVGIGALGVVPGGAGCVPKLPSGACGSLLEAMKYEKRMETAFTGYLGWWTDGRGWGDLRANTIVEWPVPYQEMQARRQTFYDGTMVSGPSNYAIVH